MKNMLILAKTCWHKVELGSLHMAYILNLIVSDDLLKMTHCSSRKNLTNYTAQVYQSKCNLPMLLGRDKYKENLFSS